MRKAVSNAGQDFDPNQSNAEVPAALGVVEESTQKKEDALPPSAKLREYVVAVRFMDNESGKVIREVGETIECSKERAAKLTKLGLLK